MSQLKMKRIVAYYATFTAVWLIASDKMVEIIFPDFAATFASVHGAGGVEVILQGALNDGGLGGSQGAEIVFGLLLQQPFNVFRNVFFGVR